MIGDFNEIKGNHEKQGGKQRIASSFTQFNLMIQNCGMLEFPCLGNQMSWRGRRQSGVVRCRLDRALANEDWHELFSHSFVEYLAMVGSDHRPIIATLEDKKPTKGKQFRFDKRWIGKEGLLESIESGWTTTNGGRGRNSFMEKISNCRRSISVWRKNALPEAKQQQIEELQKELSNIQNDDTSTQDTLVEANKRLKQAYKEEEMYWKQKSRNQWLKEGDNNTKFFHAQTKQRRAKNRIIGLHNSNNEWKTDEKDMLQIAQSYFKEIFSTSTPSNIEAVLEELPTLVTGEMNEALTLKATETEIRKVLFMMHPEKAPGPDGMTALFFQKHWRVIKDDVVDLVNNFLNTGRFETSLNMTNICLIPKVDKPSKMAEFRPISLCNVSYKIISKVLCERLKKHLPSLISETQSAFVTGRLISDNILIAQEMFHALRTTNKACQKKFMAIKTDMSKAFDRVEWNFIEKLLLKMGFASKWVSWIMWCITSVKYKIILNGNPQVEVIPRRGLRQGDPISPFIFILCTEALIANVKKAEKENQLTGLKIARGSPPISHLLFADDSLFFCKANTEQCQKLLDVIGQYGLASGQQINFNKSSIAFGHKIDIPIKEDLKRISGISNLGGMGTYLGLPESLGGSKSKIFAYVRDRLDAKVNVWSAKFLSKGGKEVLIKSVLTALPTYVMSCFRLPKGITNKLTGAISKFWWSSGDQKRGMHWLSWKKMCKSKETGGLGFRTNDDFNTALLAKQLWRLMEYPESLLAKVLKGRYFKNSSPMIRNKNYSPSYGWRSIISARSLVDRGLIMRLGSGKSVSVWKDPWIPASIPRPARSKGNQMQPDLMVEKLINQTTKTWDLELLMRIMHSGDITIIKGLPICKNDKEDKQGWHYTKSGRYTVRSGYQVEQKRNLINNEAPIYFGPDIHPLQAQAWKLKCPKKIQHFVWQTLSGALPVSVNLNNRGLNCDIGCSRCGAERETINHVLLECPPSLQTWVLSAIPSPIEVFPSTSIFTNFDYLFNVTNREDISVTSYPWILWYIWKARNDKLYNNIERDPNDVLQLATLEARSWESAHEHTEREVLVSNQAEATLETEAQFTCLIDGSWKESDSFAGLGWSCSTFGEEICLLGARNVRQSLTPLHAEFEALLWAISCMLNLGRKSVAFATDCSDVIEMINNPHEWPAFATYLEEVGRFMSFFTFFSLSLIPRICNIKADSLAKSARKFAVDIEYVNFVPPEWLSEPF